MFFVRKSLQNPILGPVAEHSWEAHAAFNGCPIQADGKMHFLYRAQSFPEKFGSDHFSLSTIGKAIFNKYGEITRREEFISPQEPWERYGCEDPRTTKLGSTYYTFYTALSGFPFNAHAVKVGVALSKDLKGPESIRERHLVTPFNAKGMALFPEKIKGKITALLTVDPDLPTTTLALAQFKDEKQMWSEEYWNEWYKCIDTFALRIPRADDTRISTGTPPIKTPYGWLILYSNIQNSSYTARTFGIEAILLDLKNPFSILARTTGPIIVPEELYEKNGVTPEVVFPSGAILEKDTLSIYYGAADAVCAKASVDIHDLVGSMTFTAKSNAFSRSTKKKIKQYKLKRSTDNPILSPMLHHFPPSRERLNLIDDWEARAVFNPAALYLGGKTHLLYRAMSSDNTSTIGYASSPDGIRIDERLSRPVYFPRKDFEQKGVPRKNSGCEDPRITQIGHMIYLCYTAYNGINPPRIAVTTISEADFLVRNWNWSEPILTTADNVDDKDGCILSEKINGKFILFHRVNSSICIDSSPDLKFSNRNSFSDAIVLSPRKGMWDSKKVGLSFPPISTPKGWLMFYHGVSDSGVYRVGAALLDKKNPQIVIGRTTDFMFEPEEKYEKEGIVPNVVFPCGAVVIEGVIYVYYGGADTVVSVATIPSADVLDSLLK